MRKTRFERRLIFWNVDINGSVKNTLKSAGFQIPEQLLGLPLVYLILLDGLGFQYVVDVLNALYNYCEISNSNKGKEYQTLLCEENHKVKQKSNTKAKELISIRKVLIKFGYTNKVKISKMTVKEVLNIKNINQEMIRMLAYEVFRTYYNSYVIPHYKFKSREDFCLNGYLIFKTLKPSR